MVLYFCQNWIVSLGMMSLKASIRFSYFLNWMLTDCLVIWLFEFLLWLEFFSFFWRLRCLILLPYRRLGLGLLMWWIVRLACCKVETLKSSWFYILHLTFRLYSVRFKIVWVHWCWCYTWSAIWIFVCYINGLVGSLYVCFGKWYCLMSEFLFVWIWF